MRDALIRDNESSRYHHDVRPSVCIVIRVAPDIISGPGRNPAKSSYPVPAGYEVGFDHLSMHLPHCVIGQEFIVLQIR